MAMGDMPQFAASAYTSTTTPLHLMGLGSLNQAGENYNNQQGLIGIRGAWPLDGGQGRNIDPIPTKEKKVATPARRLVKVIIVDPDENLPLDHCLLYSGEEKLTDATEQELFFEIDIRDLLAKHNERRIKIVDKKVKERTEHLEPAKIRDLKMVVVNVASF